MNIIPYQQKTRPPSFRKPVSTAKAEGLQAQARKHQYRAGVISSIGGITQGVIGAIKKINEAQSAVEIMTARTEVNRRKNEFLLSLNDPKNPIHYSEWEDKWTDERGSIHDDIMENLKQPESKKEFERWYERWADDAGFDIEFTMREQQINRMRVESLQAINETHDLSEVKIFIAGMKSAGLLNPGEDKEILLKAEKRILEQNYEGLKQYAWETTYSMPYEDAVKAVMNPDNFKGLTIDDRKEIKNALDVDEKLEIDRVKREHDIKRTDQNLMLGDMYTTNTLTMKFLNEETRPDGLLSDIEPSDYTKFINMIESRPKEGDKKAEEVNPDLETDDKLFMDIIKDVLAPDKDEFETNKRIAENIGADSEGNPRLSPKVAEQLTSYNKEHKDNPVFDQALSMFTQAYKDKFLTAQELAEETDKFVLKAKSGDYTPAGLIQEAENMIALKDKEYIENKLEKFKTKGKLFKQEETVEEYVARHPPEKKPMPPYEEGNITDFAVWKNVDSWASVKTTHMSSGIDAHSDDEGKTWYMKIGGVWYIANLKNNTLVPYKREK